MTIPKDQWRTYIQFIKPYEVHLPDPCDLKQNLRVKNLKIVDIKVPERISDSCSCSVLVPGKNIIDMKPSKQAKHISWVEVAFKTFMKSEFDELVPNEICVRIQKDGEMKTMIMSVEELKMLHLEAVHRLPKKKKKEETINGV